jgi:hypothetical protein
MSQGLKMLNAANCRGSRWTQPQFPSIPYAFPPSFADGRELGDTGCRGRILREELILDLVTEPMDARGSDWSFKC